MRNFVILAFFVLLSINVYSGDTTGISDSLYKKGMELLNTGKYSESIENLEKALEIKPDEYIYLIETAHAHAKRAKYFRSMHYLNRAIEINPNRYEAWYWKGLICCWGEDYKTAAQYFEKAIQYKSDSTDILYWAVIGFFKAERYEDALKCTIRINEMLPHDSLAWVNKGLILEKLKRYSEALNACDKALEIRPNWIKPINVKASIYLDSGNYAEAEKHLKISLELNSKHEGTLYILASLYSLEKKKDLMLDYLWMAKSINKKIIFEARKDKNFKEYWIDPAFKEVVETEDYETK